MNTKIGLLATLLVLAIVASAPTASAWVRPGGGGGMGDCSGNYNEGQDPGNSDDYCSGVWSDGGIKCIGIYLVGTGQCIGYSHGGIL